VPEKFCKWSNHDAQIEDDAGIMGSGKPKTQEKWYV